MIIKKGIPERINDTILKGLALGIMVYGISEGIKTGNLIIVLASLVLGGIIGEIIDIDKKLENLGTFIEGKFKNKGGNISQAFVTTSLMSVSYTHLDVYKRQITFCLLQMLHLFV